MDFQKLLGQEIVSVLSVSGGDINDAYKVVTEEKIFFAKVNSSKNSKEILRTEALGLELLKSKGNINVPKVILLKNIDDKTVLILNWVDIGPASNKTSLDFANQLTKLHKNNNLKFGLDFNNYIGTLPQINNFTDEWLEFYNLFRIQYQLKLAIDSGKLETNLIRKSENMFRNIEQDFPGVKPSLLHGDLWSGNYLIDKSSKNVFIDPATYYGHREIDIAMMKLFGGFSNDIYETYNSIMPLEKDWKGRSKFYQLYYILVHVNLFGGNYKDSAVSIINFYGR